MDTGAWRATVHGVAESDMTEHSTHTHLVNKIDEIFFPGQILKVLGDLRINILQHHLVTTSVKHFFFKELF